MTRRHLLASAGFWIGSAVAAKSSLLSGMLPWAPNAGTPPEPANPGGWKFLTEAEVRAVEAFADQIIPPDPSTPGGKDCGCAVFIDRQLAGPYGRREGLYIQPPFVKGAKVQGSQSEDGPAASYRKALAAIDAHCRKAFGKPYADLAGTDRDAVLGEMEKGTLDLGKVDAQAFFEMLIKDVQQGFFADPLYGGNKDMASWRMIGFPGTRYDYRDWVSRHNERFPLGPISLSEHPGWSATKG